MATEGSADIQVLHSEPPDASVIQKLEEVATLAHEQRLSSCAIVVIHADGSPQFFWSDAPSMGLLVGAVARLQAKLIEAVDGDD